MFTQPLLAAALLCAFSAAVLADATGYSEIFDCRAESAKIIAVHHHDWSDATRAARWKMISSDEDILGSKNTYSYIKLVDRQDGRSIFQAPVPALSYLWISTDSRFIVGLSNIKLWNPLQVVVFDAEGNVLLAKAVQDSSFPGVAESVTNSVTWYKEPSPRVSIAALGDSFILSVEGNTGLVRTFEFKDAP